MIGATKAGTTSLHAYLNNHPEIFVHPRKELRFFSAEHRWDLGLDWYREQFSNTGSVKAVGEASNSYSRYPVYAGVPERIFGVLPDARLIYLVRHPIDRIKSHYRHRLVTGREWRDPDEAVQSDPGYVAASRYSLQLQQYLEYFRLEQILVIRSEDLISETGKTLRRVYRFLGVQTDWVGPSFELNVTAQRLMAPPLLRQLSRLSQLKPIRKVAVKFARRSPLRHGLLAAADLNFRLKEENHERLVEIFEKDVMMLGNILKEDFSSWDLRANIARD